MIDPAKVCLFIGPGLKKFKLDLFERIAGKIRALGGSSIKGDFGAVERLPNDIIPIIGCSPEFKETVPRWRKEGRNFIYWDRGYARRVFATWLPRGSDGGYYRWHLNAYQMQRIRDVPSDRWDSLKTNLEPWRKGGKHVLLCEPSPTYMKHHRIEGWNERTIAEIKKYTDRPIVRRDKESTVSLADDCRDAHCMVTHGSNAAVEGVIMGCPVFVHPDSAASLVGLTDLSKIEAPVYPEREKWAHSLAYCQFNEKELVDGTLWRLME